MLVYLLEAEFALVAHKPCILVQLISWCLYFLSWTIKLDNLSFFTDSCLSSSIFYFYLGRNITFFYCSFLLLHVHHTHVRISILIKLSLSPWPVCWAVKRFKTKDLKQIHIMIKLGIVRQVVSMLHIMPWWPCWVCGSYVYVLLYLYHFPSGGRYTDFFLQSSYMVFISFVVVFLFLEVIHIHVLKH